MQGSTSHYLALDIGEKRIGIAVARADVGIAQPLTTLENDASFTEQLQNLCEEYRAGELVIGLPRGLDGQVTDQTRYVEEQAVTIEKALRLPIHWQDEAVTSQKAEAELKLRKKPYNKGDIDALAATYILEDFLQQKGYHHVEL